ncbi:hypothetical protein MRX96_029119 [Rhipicephalus microplus]
MSTRHARFHALVDAQGTGKLFCGSEDSIAALREKNREGRELWSETKRKAERWDKMGGMSGRGSRSGYGSIGEDGSVLQRRGKLLALFTRRPIVAAAPGLHRAAARCRVPPKD